MTQQEWSFESKIVRQIFDFHRNRSDKMINNLLFWNGQAFDEAGLKPVGKYRAAQAMFHDAAEIDPKVIRRWLKKAKSDVLDAKAFFKKLREAK